MSKAFNCDQCGEFFEGKGIADVVLDVKDENSSYVKWRVSIHIDRAVPIGSGYDDPAADGERPFPDFCLDCLLKIAKQAIDKVPRA